MPPTESSEGTELVNALELGIVHGHPAGHPLHRPNWCMGKGEQRADEGQDKVQFAQALIQHATGDFGEPVVNACIDAKDGAAKQHVVEVPHHVVGVVDVNVEGSCAEGDAAEAAEHKHGQQPNGKQHGAGEADLAAPQGCHPAKDFNPVGTATIRVEMVKNIRIQGGVPLVNMW
jgi:hypothetical protein